MAAVVRPHNSAFAFFFRLKGFLCTCVCVCVCLYSIHTCTFINLLSHFLFSHTLSLSPPLSFVAFILPLKPMMKPLLTDFSSSHGALFSSSSALWPKRKRERERERKGGFFFSFFSTQWIQWGARIGEKHSQKNPASSRPHRTCPNLEICKLQLCLFF